MLTSCLHSLLPPGQPLANAEEFRPLAGQASLLTPGGGAEQAADSYPCWPVQLGLFQMGTFRESLKCLPTVTDNSSSTKGHSSFHPKTIYKHTQM